MAILLRATNEVVAVGWLRGVTGLSKSMVDLELPDEVTAWPTGFVTVQSVGGQRNMYVPLVNPVFGVDCWATSMTDSDPPWGTAHQLAELIDRGCRSRGAHRRVTATGYDPVMVHSAYLVTEPRRLYAGEGNYARVTLNLAMHWTDLS